MARLTRRAYTLIELLLVVALVSLLLQLTLPAVQSARESARQRVCQDHLRQLGLAAAAHEAAHGHLPTGGWSWQWLGDADRGFGRAQPGGWVYAVLPYLERTELRKLGQGLPPAEKARSAAALCQAPQSILHCPTRRSAIAYPLSASYSPLNCDLSSTTAKSDYAASAGDVYEPTIFGPDSLDDADSGRYTWPVDQATGVIYRRSATALGEITDGLSQTYLLGEKYLEPGGYSTGDAPGDNSCAFGGFDEDLNRWTARVGIVLVPVADQDGFKGYDTFGSAHPSACAFLYCDGGVRTVSYDVDPQVHRGSGTRAGHEPLP